MDKLLDTFEHRMEFELSLNATQTAHARQILSDLMDKLEGKSSRRKKKPGDALWCGEYNDGTILSD
jgi:hypothetical protein